MRDSMYLICMSLKMQHAIQPDTTFRMATFKLSLILRQSKVGFHVLFQDVFSRDWVHPSFVHELVVAYTNKAYWVGEHCRIQMWALNRLVFVGFECAKLWFHSLAMLMLWRVSVI